MPLTTFSEISLFSYLFKWLEGLDSKLRIGLANIGQATNGAFVYAWIV